MIFFFGGGGGGYTGVNKVPKSRYAVDLIQFPKLIGSEMSLPVDSLFNFVNVFQLMNKSDVSVVERLVTVILNLFQESLPFPCKVFTS